MRSFKIGCEKEVGWLAAEFFYPINYTIHEKYNFPFNIPDYDRL